MEAGDWVTILSTGAVVSLISGGLQVWSNRKNLKAGTTQILTDAAGEFTGRIMERLRELERKDEVRDREDMRRDQALRVHSRWDRKVIRRLQEALPDLEIEDPPPLYPEDFPMPPPAPASKE